MFGGKDADWRSQLDSKYSESAEFQEILSQYTEEKHVDPAMLFPHSSAVADASAPMHKMYPAIRFPPLSKMTLPPPLEDAQFIKELDAVAMARQSMKLDDSLAGIHFLEAMLKSLYEKVKEIRESVIENGNYLHYLTKPLRSEDITNIHSVVLENLVLMRDDSAHLLEEIQVFGIEKMHEIITIDTDSTAHVALIASLRESLISRGQALQDAAATSLLTIDHLTEYAYSLVHYPPQPYCAADGLASSWEQRIEFQTSKAKWSRVSLQYLAYSCSRALPACNAFFAYLQNPAEYDYRLWIQDSPLGAAFSAIIHFLALQHRRSPSPRESISHSLKDLVLSNCGLHDGACTTLANHLTLFPHLTSLRLSRNKITYSGIASFATHVFEHGSQLRLLYLDHNRINKEGASLLAQILPRMKHLQELSVAHNPIRDAGALQILKHTLNPKRKAYATLPRLHAAQSLAYSLARRSTRTAESDSLLGELDMDMDAADGEDSLARGVDGLALRDAWGEAADEGEEEAEEDGEEDEEEEEEEEVRAGTQSPLSRYPPQCYLTDYFLVSTARATGHRGAGQDVRGSLLQQVLWVNDAHEEFDMDAASDYSDDSSPSAAVAAAGGGGEGEEGGLSQEEEKERERDGVSWSQRVGSGPRSQQQLQQQAKYPLLVRKVLALRLRLAAVSLFRTLRQRGHPSLTTLRLQHCSLTPSLWPALCHAVADNHSLTSLDLSGHPLLLASAAHCQRLAEALPHTRLRRLGLRHVGLTDAGLLALSRALVASSGTLTELHLARNPLGPTGANLVANLAKTFAVDALAVHGGGQRRSAPLRMDGLPHRDDDEEDEEERGRGRRQQAEQQRRVPGVRSVRRDEEEADETASYVDHDLFEGDDSDEDIEDEEDEVEQQVQESRERGRTRRGRTAAPSPSPAPEVSPPPPVPQQQQGGEAAGRGRGKGRLTRSTSLFQTAARFSPWPGKARREKQEEGGL